MTLELEPNAKKFSERRLKTTMLERLDNCGVPTCWTIKEPIATNRVLWVPKDQLYGNRRKGRLVQLKRIIYWWEYDVCPLRSIKNLCKNNLCANPAHFKVPPELRSKEMVHRQIDNKLLTEEDARNWGLFNGGA